MKLSTKITLAFGTFIVMIFIIGAGGVAYLLYSNDKNEEIADTQKIVLAYNDVAFQTVRANAAIRGYMIYAEDYMKDNHYEIRDTLHATIDSLKQLGEESDDFNEFLTQLAEWEAGIDDKIFPLIEQGNHEQAKEVSGPILGEGSSNLVMFAKGMANENNEVITEDFSSIVTFSKNMIIAVAIITALALIGSIILTLTFGRKLRNSITLVIEKINTFASGDFNVHLDLKSKDEFGDLANSFNDMTKSLKVSMYEVNDSSSQVAAMAEEFSASSVEVSTATAEITNSIVNISDGMENQTTVTSNVNKLSNSILTEIQEILETVQLTQNRVEEADELSAEGQKEVAEVNKQMAIILENSANITAEINELSEQTEAITKNAIAIKEIAEQTNLLALNASIEAARAGESGKGFAVVADEVRKLAEASNSASVSIEEVIYSVAEKINRTVEVIDSNNESVKEGQVRVTANGEMFDQITGSIANVKTQTDEVQESIQTISSNIEKLAGEIEHANAISEQANDESQSIVAAAEEQSATMTEIADASNELATLAMNLQTIIQKYRF